MTVPFSCHTQIDSIMTNDYSVKKLKTHWVDHIGAPNFSASVVFQKFDYKFGPNEHQSDQN